MMVLAVLFLGLFASESFALDRYGSVGVSVLTPVTVEPKKERGSEVYSIDLQYFFSERLTNTWTWDFAVEGEGSTNLGVGFGIYPWLDLNPNPYASAEFLYFFDPKGDVGWRVSLGGEYDLARYTKVNNLSLYGETGFSHLIMDGSPDRKSWDALRMGFAWSF